jgi:hypothetical protein
MGNTHGVAGECKITNCSIATAREWCSVAVEVPIGTDAWCYNIAVGVCEKSIAGKTV